MPSNYSIPRLLRSALATGDLIYKQAAAGWARLTLGVNGSLLGSNGTLPAYVQCPVVNGFRLTLTSGLPVTTADVSGVGTIYLTPYTGNEITLLDASDNPYLFASAEISLAISAVANKVYDVFVYNNAGTLTLVLSSAWSSNTARADAVHGDGTARIKGIACLASDHTRRLIGTFVASATNATSDTEAKRWLWNADNRVWRAMKVVDSTDQWIYTTATWRQANASTSNQLDYVVGLAEDPVIATVRCEIYNTTSNIDMPVGVGVDSTSVNSAQLKGGRSNNALGYFSSCDYQGIPGQGKHSLVWLEYCAATGTGYWYGDSGLPDLVQSGLMGRVKA